jgi:stress-induced morphogen
MVLMCALALNLATLDYIPAGACGGGAGGLLNGWTMTNRYERIHQILHSESFKPVALEIIDESAKHASHAARNPGRGRRDALPCNHGVSCFAGQSRLARSRAVHEALDAEFKSGLHALSLKLRTPEEAA